MSELSRLFNQLAKSPSTSSGTTGWLSNPGNKSWYEGSSRSPNSPHVKSYVTVTKTPTNSSSSAADTVQSKLGVNVTKGTIKGKKKKSHNSSIFGDILGGYADIMKNTATDVIDMAEGAGPGLLKVATTNPKDTAIVIAHDYKRRYGPLFGYATGGGDIGKFLTEVKRHPLAPALDISTVLTLGGAAAAKAVPTLAEGGTTALRVDRSLVKAGEAEATTRPLSKNIFTRNAYEKPAYALQRVLPSRLPILGERAAAVRTITNKLESGVGDISHHQHQLVQTVHKIRQAAHKDDTVTQAFDQVAADIRHRPLQTFGDTLDTPTARNFDSKVDFKLNETTRHSPEIDDLANVIKSQIQPDSRGMIVAKDGASAETHAFVKLHNTRETLNQSLTKVETLVAKADAQGYAAKIPGYRAGKRVGESEFNPSGVSLGVKSKGAEGSMEVKMVPNPHYKPAGMNYKTGKATASKGEPMIPESELYTEAEGSFVSAGRKSTAPIKNQTKYEEPSKISQKKPSRRSGRQAAKVANQVAPKDKSYLDGVRRVDTHTDSVANYLEMHSKGIKSAGNALSKDFLEKYGKDPKLTKELGDLFDKKGASNSLSGNFNKATQLWKDVILAGRPAFLVNNFVGNQIMFHLKQGFGGKALQMSAHGELNKAFEHHFFEHRQSLGGSEAAEGTSFYRRNVNKVYGTQAGHEQVLRKATMREAAMAIPAIKTEMRKLISEKNLTEGEALDQAMTKAFKTADGDTYKQMIGKAIDDTLGNYRHYSSAEKKLKGAVPFYGWQRHALRTTASIIKDQPLTANVTSHVGAIGKEDNAKNFPGTPAFMGTYVKTRLGTFDTQALNPLKGGSDTIKMLRELGSGQSGNLPTVASALNPFIGAAAQGLTGVNMTTGAPVKTTGGLSGAILEQVVGGLPQIKLGKIALGMNDTGNRRDPHYFLTPTGQLKHKFIDSTGKVMFGPDGLPLEAADRHMLAPSFINGALGWVGIPKRDVNLVTAQTVAKSIDSKLHPDADFHERKKRAKKTVTSIVSSTTKKHKTKGSGYVVQGSK